jgi:hypothetical protein
MRSKRPSRQKTDFSRPDQPPGGANTSATWLKYSVNLKMFFTNWVA